MQIFLSNLQTNSCTNKYIKIKSFKDFNFRQIQKMLIHKYALECCSGKYYSKSQKRSEYAENTFPSDNRINRCNISQFRPFHRIKSA